MNSPSDKQIEKLETDVVIIGAGGSGLAAAMTVAEKGAKVVVIEKRAAPGGNSAFAGGIVAAESPVQKRQHVDATKEYVFNIAMQYSHWTLNARLVRSLIEKSGDTVGWLEERGVTFRLVSVITNQIPQVFHCPDRKGLRIMPVIIQECDKLGVSILCNTRAIKLLTNSSGGVIGTIAKGENKDFEINAKVTVIASGGFGANGKLLKKYFPFYNKDLKYMGLKDACTGDGMLMAYDIGAASEGLGNWLLLGPCYSGARGAWAGDLWVLAQEPVTIWVNKDGERFMEEAPFCNPFEPPNAIFRQPGSVCFSIFDDTIKRDVITAGFERPGGRPYAPSIPKIDEEMKNEAIKGGVKISNSWDEIAEWMGADPKTLINTIEEYNRCCEKGHDDLFAKDRKHLKPLHNPPYYAVRCDAGLLATFGGIKINYRMEVLGKDDKPIIGLYAVGTETGGWAPDSYNAHLPGVACGFAINSGRIAGEHINAYLSKFDINRP